MIAPEYLGPSPEAAARAGVRDGPRWTQTIVGLGIFTYVVVFGLGVITFDFTLLDPAFWIPLLLLATIPIARRIARAERDRTTFAIVMAAFSAHLLGALARQWVSATFYHGTADSNDFAKYGKRLAPYYQQLDFSPNLGKLSGSGFMRGLTGVVYAIFGTSELGGYVIFAWFSFVGGLLLWRAFRRAVPDGDGRRYGLLVLFLPSMLYWPSALGKEAWALMSLGLAAYGVARALDRKVASGVACVAAGLGALMMLRPHVALLFLSGLVLAAFLGKPKRSTLASPFVRGLTFVALGALAIVLVSQTQSFLGTDSLDQQTVDKKLTEAQGRTSEVEVGSRFSPVTVHTPLDYPLAAVTVMFRPAPWEAHNLQAFLGVAEVGFILWLTWKSRRRLRHLWSRMRSEPYVAVCVGYILTFIYAFSAYSNFGILSRQRVQVWPFYLVLVCLPDATRSNDDAEPNEPEQLRSVDYGPPAPEELTDPYARFRGRISADPYADHEAADPYAQLRDARADPYAGERSSPPRSHRAPDA